MANCCLPSASCKRSRRSVASARPTKRRKMFGAAMGRTPRSPFRSGVSLEVARAAAALSGTRPSARRSQTPQKAPSAPESERTTRQCSNLPPPTAAPLPLGLARRTFCSRP
eukprot:9470963-Pyramimonas_sp.AAC.1